MGIGAPDAKGADPADARLPLRDGPGLGLGAHLEGRGLQIEAGVGGLIVQGGGEGPVTKGQGGLDEAGDPCGGVEVAEVGLDGPQGAIAHGLGVVPEDLGEGLDLNGVAKGGGGAVALDVGEVLGVNLGHGLGHGDTLSLAIHGRGGIAGLVGAIIVEGIAGDDREDIIPLL